MAKLAAKDPEMLHKTIQLKKLGRLYIQISNKYINTSTNNQRIIGSLDRHMENISGFIGVVFCKAT